MDNLVKRINELANKAKVSELSKNEKVEQQKLREEYIAGFRSDLTNTLENTYIIDKDGNKVKVKKNCKDTF